jgi:glycosyltransferase involved in cell wall biosynthesis
MTPGALGVVIARCTGVPVVVATVHVTANHYGRKVWLPKCVAAPLCNAFLCVSKVAEESFFGSSEIFSEAGFDRGLRHFAIPNCVDIEAVDAVRRLGPPADLASKLNIGSRPVIGILSRLDPFKGHDVLLDALALVRCDTPDALALCVGAGAGDWPDKLRRQANALGLHDHVIWAGGMTQAMAFRHLMLMDIVVMPSRPNLEGFGLVAAEAMAFEKPVIASDVDGLAEVVGRDGAGMLVPPGDVAALAGAIGQLLHDPDRRAALGIAGRNRVEKQYSMDVFADRHLRLYGKLLGGRA